MPFLTDFVSSFNGMPKNKPDNNETIKNARKALNLAHVIRMINREILTMTIAIVINENNNNNQI
jgi:predicted subunit of tRNA(5-methylaminomethyl-2-thiouridylate) methyltransferase